jgi:hypothetical protein
VRHLYPIQFVEGGFAPTPARDAFGWLDRQRLVLAAPVDSKCPKCGSLLFLDGRAWRTDWLCFCCDCTGTLQRWP